MTSTEIDIQGNPPSWELSPMGSPSHTSACDPCEAYLVHLSSCWGANENGLRALVRSLLNASNKILVLEAQSSTLRSQLDAANSVQSSPRYLDAEESNRRLRSKRDEFRQALEQETLRCTAQNDQIRTLTLERDEALAMSSTLLREKDGTLESLHLERNKSATDLDALRVTNECLTSRIVTLEAELRSARSARATQEEENRKLLRDLEALKERTLASHPEREQLARRHRGSVFDRDELVERPESDTSRRNRKRRRFTSIEPSASTTACPNDTVLGVRSSPDSVRSDDVDAQMLDLDDAISLVSSDHYGDPPQIDPVIAPVKVKPVNQEWRIPPAWVPEAAYVSSIDGKWRAGSDKEVALRNESAGLPPPPDVPFGSGIPMTVDQVKEYMDLAQQPDNELPLAYVVSWVKATEKIPPQHYLGWMSYLRANWRRPSWIKDRHPDSQPRRPGSGSRAPDGHGEEAGAERGKWYRACAELLAYPGRYRDLVSCGLVIATKKLMEAADVPQDGSFSYRDAACELARQGISLEEADDAQPYGFFWLLDNRKHRYHGDAAKALVDEINSLPQDTLDTLFRYEPQVYPDPEDVLIHPEQMKTPSSQEGASSDDDEFFKPVSVSVR